MKFTAQRHRLTKRLRSNHRTTKHSMGTARLLKLSDQEFKTTVINMVRVPMGKVDNMQEQMRDVIRGKEILRKNGRDHISREFDIHQNS